MAKLKEAWDVLSKALPVLRELKNIKFIGSIQSVDEFISASVKSFAKCIALECLNKLGFMFFFIPAFLEK